MRTQLLSGRRALIFNWLSGPSLLGLLLVTVFCGQALADDEVIPPDMAREISGEEQAGQKIFNTGTAFFDEASIGGGVYYFQRKRERYNITDDRWENNLDHSTVQAALHFDSGWTGDGWLQLGFDLGVYGSKDLNNDGSPDHEMNFVPWSSPWRADYGSDTSGGFSIYKANAKLQTTGRDTRWWARAGYLQPTGPGVLSVNWSILPGSYQGLETGLDFGSPGGSEQALPGKLEIAAMLVNAYKAPWYKTPYILRKRDGDTRIDYMWSLGARYSLQLGEEGAPSPSLLTLEAAYGASDDYLKNFHFKAGYAFPAGPGQLELKYHFYGMLDNDNSGSVNDNFDGLAYQHYLGAFYNLDLWKFRLEYSYTRVPQSNDNHLNYFAYRMTNPTGSSKGAYDVWWDARSDWDHDQEMAAFAGISRGLDDLGLVGVSLGIGGAIGWDGRARGHAQHLKEYAWTADIGYVRPEGPLKGASVSLHFTRYYNRTDLPSWNGYQNAFQDEKDVKFLVAIPF